MLDVRGVCKRYGKTTVLRQVSMTVHTGECVGIVGANGVGKSTLLEILAGGLAPDEGEIYMEGERVSGAKLAERTGFVPQENPLFEDLTVKDNLELWYRGRRREIERDMESGHLRTLGIPEFYKKKVSRLSGGMKKRLSIACALAERPKLLILDEPGAALDFVAKNAIIEYIRQYAQAGHSVLMVSHELPELAVCGRLYGMKDGRLEQLESEIDSEHLTDWMLG